MYCLNAGLPSRYALSQRKKTFRRGEVRGVQVKCIFELEQYCYPLTYPEAHELESWTKQLMFIPMDLKKYGVEGACFTGKMQINWIGQILDRPHQFALHSDGKHKLHHGKWIMQTVGTHYLKWDNDRKCMSTSFVPLIYMFCAQHESCGSCRMLLDALVLVGKRYFPETEMLPGATVSDHSDRFVRAACVCAMYLDCILCEREAYRMCISCVSDLYLTCIVIVSVPQHDWCLQSSIS